MNRSLARTTLQSVAYSLSGMASLNVLQFLALAMLARILSPADYGIIGTALIVTGLAAVFSDIGFGPALVQKSDLTPAHIRVAFTLSVLLGAVVCGIIILSAKGIALYFQLPRLVPVLWALAFIFVFRGIAVVSESLLQREMRFGLLAGIEVTSYVAGFGVIGIPLALAGFGAWALAAGYLGQAVARTVLATLLRRHPTAPSFNFAVLKELGWFGSGLTMARVANYAANQADNLVVARYLGANALGIYGRAYQLLVTPATLVGQGLDRVLFPVFASVKEDVGRLALAFCRGSAVAALITIPASVCLYLSAEELIWVVLGANWMPVVPPFKILVIGLLCRTSFKLSTCLARATAAVFQCGWRQVVYAAAIFAGATAGAHYGLQGVAAAVLAALILNHVLMTGLALRITGIGWGGYLLLHTPGITTGTIVWLSLQALASLGGPLAARPLTTLCLKIGVSAISALSGWLLIPQFALGSHGTRMVWLLREQARQTGLAAPATGGLMRRFARAGLTQH